MIVKLMKIWYYNHMNKITDKQNKVFEEILADYEELNQFISSIEIMSDVKLYNHYLKKFKQLESVALPLKKIEVLKQDIEACKEMLNDAEVEDKVALESQIQEIEQQIESLYADAKNGLAKNKLFEQQNISVEINSKEDAEFVTYLKDLLKTFFEKNNAKFEIKKEDASSVQIEAEGRGIFELTNVFSGKVKKVQFGTESFANFVVLKNIECDDSVDEDDLMIQTTRSSGAGGQHINKTDSAVRITHVPTGIVVECQEERSQTKNKEKALARLKEKIAQINQKKIQNNEENQRKIIKNKLFGTTATAIFDFDENKIIMPMNKLEYKIKEIETGNFETIFSDINE